MKLKAYFQVTTHANIPGYYIDDEMFLWADMDKVADFEKTAFAWFVKEFLVEAQPMPVCTKIELDRIEDGKGKVLKSYRKEWLEETNSHSDGG